MPGRRVFSEIRLVNGSTGDPCLFVDYPGRHNAILFDAGDNGAIDMGRLSDLQAVFITHHHVDHFIGFDRIVRSNIDSDKTLSVYGPDGTIRKIYDRIKSYEYQFFPFQRIRIGVYEIVDDCLRAAVLECSRRFPEPVISDRKWDGRVVYEDDELTVEACPVEHTVPCLAYALVERSGYHADADKLAAGSLRPGSWVDQALKMLRAGAAGGSRLEIHGGQFRLDAIAAEYFKMTSGSRVAYVTDTCWNDRTRPGLLRLARGAQRLYCDSFYAHAQLRQAMTHRHMTATQAAEFATLAKVDELILMHFASRYAGRYESLVDEARAVFPNVSAHLE
jgi:ribonuclease Z